MVKITYFHKHKNQLRIIQNINQIWIQLGELKVQAKNEIKMIKIQ